MADTYPHHGFHADPETGVCYRTLEFFGFPGYRVGDDGSVWSRLATVTRGGQANGFKTVLLNHWTKLTPVADKRTGHVRASLCPGARLRSVHRLVLEAFVGPPPDGLQCCHNDGRSANNRLENLRWGTIRENAHDRAKHGTETRGEKHKNSRLTVPLVKALRAEYATGTVTMTELGLRHGIGKATIRSAIRRETWKHV